MKQKINSLLKIFLFFTVAFLGSTICANATYIKTSASGTDSDGGEYGYFFAIENGTTPFTYHAELVNTSDASSNPEALIDAFAFNFLDPDPVFGDDFFIQNISSNWTFQLASGGIQFDYVGNRDNPEDRLGAGDKLTFDFVFDSGYSLPPGAASYFDLWLQAEKSTGGGFGGGEDLGQVGVSFQQLYDADLGPGEGSDLLASNWDGPYDGQIQDIVPEPATFMLFGIGLLGIARVSRRKK